MPANSDNSLYKYVPEALRARVSQYGQDWQQACQAIDAEPTANIDLSLLGKVWACSEFMARTMIRHPRLWLELVQNKALQQTFNLEDYQQQLNQRLENLAADNDIALMRALRLFRQQQMMRIAWRDLCDLAVTSETLANLSELAECCVDISLERVYQDQCRQLGVPLRSDGSEQRLVVLGMGKLGGGELNFSSDIDLIFSFAEEGEISGARSLANSQFFIRLGQRLIKVLNDVTADGFVFRVDMRLRPYGESGPLVMSHDAMEQYYQSQGRDWERYAMIKARVIAGDRLAGQALMDMLKPFVYRRYLDFGAFESIRDMKVMIDREIRRKGNLQNIKLGSGGIREIEFIAQTFQLIRGGGDPELQVRGILEVMNRLADKGYLERQEALALLQSYDFLRRLENRLQMYDDRQTHLLPDDELQQQALALAMGYESWASLYQACEKHRRSVHGAFAQLLHETEDTAPQDSDSTDNPLQHVWLHDLPDTEAIELLQQAGMGEAEQIHQQLKLFRNASHLKSVSLNGRQRLDTLMPRLLTLLLNRPQVAQLLNRLINLLQAILRRSVYLSLLNEYPQALKQLVNLCDASPWIAHLLSRYPVLLDELLDAHNLYQIPQREKLQQALDEQLRPVANDEEQQIEYLRKFRQAQVLKIAAMDIAGALSVFEVSEQLSHIAEVLLQKVMSLAWQWMLEKYGRPVCVLEGGGKYYPTLGIVAYGKMGGRELGYGSDLDLVFLHDSQGSQQQTDGARCLDNASFFARLAQRIIHLLSAQTANGRLYEIDMRLRPDGNAGMLVSSLQAYDIYQHEKAWTWEHQALVRARMLCSSTHLKTEFDRIRDSVLSRPRQRSTLAGEIAEMREKMRKALGSSPGSGLFHIKQDAGGLVDIEFIAQYGVLLKSSEDRDLLKYTATRKIIQRLGQSGLLSSEQVAILYEACRQYREWGHQRALQELSSQIEQPADDSALGRLRNSVRDIWQDVLQKYAEPSVTE